MLTTKQVRNVMRNHLFNRADIWTNKTSGNFSIYRSVKCYVPSNDTKAAALLAALVEAAGEDNVKVTDGSEYLAWPGIIVRCTIA